MSKTTLKQTLRTEWARTIILLGLLALGVFVIIAQQNASTNNLTQPTTEQPARPQLEPAFNSAE